MSNISVYCVARTFDQADQMVVRLKGAGFSDNDISALFPDRTTSRDFAHEKNTKAPEGALTGVGTGGVVGGTLGLLAGIGVLTIPGVGLLIAAGPILSALSGAAVGAAAGGMAGALIGLGIPEYEARRYEGKLREGNILLSIHAENSDQVKLARSILEQMGATEIATSGEAEVPQRSAHDPVSDTMDDPEMEPIPPESVYRR